MSILTQEKDVVIVRVKERCYKNKTIKVVVGIKVCDQTAANVANVTALSPKRKKV
jgi:hypothetical protein